MANRGDSFTNPVTGEHCVVRESDPAAGRTLVDLYVEPGGAVAGEHVHDNLVERFEVIEGRVGFRIDGGEELAEPGRRAEVAAGVAHDWWNAGDTRAHVLVEVDGAASRSRRARCRRRCSGSSRRSPAPAARRRRTRTTAASW